MDNHAVPRQITTFEFKLLGFFTVKQGIYLAVFAGLAVIVFYIIPVPILNLIMASLVVGIGVLLVFFRHNERSMDVWIKNLLVSLMKPSQFFFHKNNDAPEFLKGVTYFDEATAKTHVDASQKLSKYITQTGQGQVPSQQKQDINVLIHTTAADLPQAIPTQASATVSKPVVVDQPIGTVPQTQSIETETDVHTPFLSGVIRNNKEDLLPNIMVYLNTDAGQLVRILKTNHNGIFATFHPLPSGSFIISPKDLGGTYFFDTMNIQVDGPQKEPLQIYSKEIL